MGSVEIVMADRVIMYTLITLPYSALSVFNMSSVWLRVR